MGEKQKVKFVVYEPTDGEISHDSLKECKKDIEHNKVDLSDVKIYQVYEVRKDVTEEFMKRYFPEETQ